MAKYTTNYNLVKPELTDAPPDITVLDYNWDTLDIKIKELSDRSSASETVKSYNVLPEMWVGTEFPYTCTFTHKLGGEPTSQPLVDLDLSSYSTLDNVEAVEYAYGLMYRCTFDATNIVLYSKEIPETAYKITVKAVI